MSASTVMMTLRGDDPADARARVRAAARDLRPGLYLRVGPQLWRRVGAPRTPIHLTRTKGRAPATKHGRGALVTALRRLVDVRHAFLVGHGSGTAELAIAAFDGGTVLIDPRNAVVLRTYGDVIVDDKYLAWREAFTRHVDAPRFRLASDGRTLIEEFVDGRHLLDESTEARVMIVRRLIASYAELTALDAISPPVVDYAQTLSRVVQESQIESLWHAWQGADRRWMQAAEAIWVPSAYEATAKNLMVRSNGAPSPIDLGDLRPEPFFSYPIGVMVSSGVHVVAAYLSGEIDGELDELFASAHVSWLRTDQQRRGLLLVRMVHAAVCDDVAGAESLEKSLARRWAEMQWLLETSRAM